MSIKEIDITGDLGEIKRLLKFVPIEDIVDESDSNLKKDIDGRMFLVSWTDNHEEALMIVDVLNNSYTGLWCTPHKSFEHFKKWFIEREVLTEYEGEDLYMLSNEPFEYWNPPVGLNPPSGSIFEK